MPSNSNMLLDVCVHANKLIEPDKNIVCFYHICVYFNNVYSSIAFYLCLYSQKRVAALMTRNQVSKSRSPFSRKTATQFFQAQCVHVKYDIKDCISLIWMMKKISIAHGNYM